MNTKSGSRVILAVIYLIDKAIRKLPPCSSSLTEQGRQGGIIFPTADCFVMYVVQALEDHPDLFPDLAGRAPALREKQRWAWCWLVLQAIGLGLADLGRRGFLRDQSEAVTEGKAILARVKLLAENPDLMPELDHDTRGVCLGPAYRVLSGHFQELRNLAALARLRKAGRLPPAAPKAAKKAKDQRKIDDNAALEETFRRIIPTLSRK